MKNIFLFLVLTFLNQAYGIVGGKEVKETLPIYQIRSYEQKSIWIGNSISKVQSKYSVGSSFSIAPNILVTAAHTVMKQKIGNDNVIELVDQNGNVQTFFENDYSVYIPEEFLENERTKNKDSCYEDISFITFKKNIFSDYLSFGENGAQVGEEVFLYGYGPYNITYSKDMLFISNYHYLEKRNEWFGFLKGERLLLYGVNKIHSHEDNHYFFTIRALKKKPSFSMAYGGKGDSGAPVLNHLGEVVGLMCKIYDNSSKKYIYNKILNFNKPEGI